MLAVALNFCRMCMLDTEMMGGFGDRMEQEVQEQEYPRETCL